MATLWAVFVVGLAGGFGHCIGMCGALVAASGLMSGAAGSSAGSRTARSASVVLWQAAYQSGRVLAYACLGGLLGALGSLGAIRGALGPVQRWVWLVAGVLMVVMGLAIAGVPLFTRVGRTLESGAGVATSRWYTRAYAALAARGPVAAVPLGMLHALLPCGFLLSIEVAALGSGSAVLGALTMASFGLGTVPALAGFGAVSGMLGSRGRSWLLYAGSAIVVALGVRSIVQAADALLAMPR
ncbi:MAG: sulfite exporter TauE/SafE family protein [Coriobacteriia bacterium]|nr:sulfite exporter TauE/SafE family protein [Coriobacteriia bacterium]